MDLAFWRICLPAPGPPSSLKISPNSGAGENRIFTVCSGFRSFYETELFQRSQKQYIEHITRSAVLDFKTYTSQGALRLYTPIALEPWTVSTFLCQT
jgi:hypothetical protein